MLKSTAFKLCLALLGAAGIATRAHAEVKPNALTEAEKRSGWKLLFDGQSADQWRNYRKDALSSGWAIQDGTLTRAERGAGDIVSRQQFDSFELQLEYRISKAGNSGLMFHVTEDGTSPWHSGPEVQVQDNVDGHDPQKSGWLYQLYKPEKPAWAIKFENQVGYKGVDVDDAARPAGEWNHIYLRVTPKDGEVCVNGVSYYKFVKGSDDWNERVAKSKFAKMPNFGKPTTGHICLQDHNDLVSYRSIKIRELPASGQVPNPVDGKLEDVAVVPAFPHVEWESHSTYNEAGRQNPPLRPIQITHAGDGSNRVFVIDQSGMIHVLPNDPAATKATLYADLRDRVHHFKIDDEEGLLGFAFHPNYKQNGEFYIYYNPEGKDRGVALSRFKVSKEDPGKADPASEEVLMEFKQPFSNHNGGPMAFGNDGYLYIGLGDGGGRNDPEKTGQDLHNLFGCVLRIDVDHKASGRQYGIPADNPFVGKEGVPPEVFAYGFRNPWRLTVDRQTGNVWLSDVGQDLWEEVDIVQKGGNYGWSVREGSYNFNNAPGTDDVKAIDPVWEYDHRIGKSITGGHVYRGSKIPSLRGHYLYGDYISGLLWALQYDEQSGKVVRNMAIDWPGKQVLAFGEDEQGEQFITTATINGQGIFRFVAK